MKDQRYFSGDREPLHVLMDSIHAGDISRWNNWKASHSGQINLSGANLKNTDISGAIFDDCRLDRVWFYDSKLNGCSFRRASVLASHFSKSVLDHADFTEAKLAYSDFEKCSCIGTNFSSAQASNVTFAAITAFETNFSRAKLSGSDYRFSRLERSDFSSAKLTAVSFLEATIINSIFTHANLRRSHWVKADVRGATLTGCQVWGWTTESWRLADISCHYVYDDEMGVRRMPEQPRNGNAERDFQPGEFVKIFRHMPTFRMVFERGVRIFDVILVNDIVQKLNLTAPELGIRIRGIENKGVYPEIIFECARDEDREDSRARVIERYEEKIAHLQEINGMLATENERLAIMNAFLLKSLDQRPGSPVTVTAGRGSKVAVVIGSSQINIDFASARNEVDQAISTATLTPGVGERIKRLLAEFQKEGVKETAKILVQNLYALVKEHRHVLPNLAMQLQQALASWPHGS